MSEPIARRRPMIDLEEFERRLRQPAATSRPAEDDPLAELARLVSSQDDPYKAMFGSERQGQPATRTPEAGKELDDPARSYREPVEPMGGPSPLIFDTVAARESRVAERGGEIAATPDQWPMEEYGDSAYASDFAEDEEPRSRRPLYLMAAIIIVGMAGIAASFVMKGARTGPDEIATIRAPEGPAKVAVETPAASGAAGVEVSVLERGQQAQRVGLVDTREQPVDLSQVQHAPRMIAIDGSRVDSGKVASGAAQVPVPAPPPQAHAPRPQDTSVGAAVPIEPRKVKTVMVRPDGTLVANPPPPRPAADVPVPARRPVASTAPVAKPTTPKIAERAETTPKPIAPAPPAAASQVAALASEGIAAAPGAAATKGTYAVQLAAPESEEEARAIQFKMMKKHGNDLTGFHTSIRKAVVGDKTVYRVRVGDLTREQAAGLCQRIQSSGTACFVAKN